MGELQIKKVNNFYIKLLKTLNKLGKGAAYAIKH